MSTHNIGFWVTQENYHFPNVPIIKEMDSSRVGTDNTRVCHLFLSVTTANCNPYYQDVHTVSRNMQPCCPVKVPRLNQRSSGPVNAHLTPGPGIYFNAFIHVYSPRARADNTLRENVDVNRKPLSLCPFVANFKTISLKYDFKQSLNDFIPVYSPRARAENPLGTNFWCKQKALITLTICCKFQTNLFEFWFYTHFLMFFHMYLAPGQGQTILCGQNPDVNRKALSPRPFVESLKKIPCLILYIIFRVFIHVYSPRAGVDNPLGSEFLHKHKPFVTQVICCKFLPLNDFLTVFSHIKA